MIIWIRLLHLTAWRFFVERRHVWRDNLSSVCVDGTFFFKIKIKFCFLPAPSFAIFWFSATLLLKKFENERKRGWEERIVKRVDLSILLIKWVYLTVWPDGQILFSIFGHLQQENEPKAKKLYPSGFKVVQITNNR